MGALPKRVGVNLTRALRTRIISYAVADSSRGPGYRPLKAETRVRIPYPLLAADGPGEEVPGALFVRLSPSCGREVWLKN